MQQTVASVLKMKNIHQRHNEDLEVYINLRQKRLEVACKSGSHNHDVLIKSLSETSNIKYAELSQKRSYTCNPYPFEILYIPEYFSVSS